MGPNDKKRTPDKSHGRKRRYHKRSKLGCLICRWRHIRCDEGRPSCANCMAWDSQCIYPQPDRIPSEEKRLKPQYPGEQASWRVDIRPSPVVDPIDALPISMPLRSRALIHHFVQVCGDLGQFLPQGSQIDLLSLGAEDPIVFRSIFLTAASHYALKTGTLHAYEATYRFHMVECVRRVNGWLSNFDGSREATLRCVQAIAALSITESRVGNFEAASAHLDGLLSVLEMRDSRRATLNVVDDEELQNYIERCVLLTEKFMIGIWDARSRNLQQRRCQLDDREKKLQALSFTPFFLNQTPAIMSPKEIDVDHFLGVMRTVTAVHTRNCSVCSIEEPHSPADGDLTTEDAFVEISNGAADLLTWFGKTYSTDVHDKPHSPYRSAPLPICILGGLYFNRVLGFKSWDKSSSIELRSFKRQMLAVKRDIQNLEQDMHLERTSRDLWLIKVMCAILGMIIAEKDAGPSFLRDFGASDFWFLRAWFVERLRIWANVNSTTEWSQAQKALRLISGSQTFPRERLARSLWEEAMVQSPPIEELDKRSDPAKDDPWGVWNSRHAFFTV